MRCCERECCRGTLMSVPESAGTSPPSIELERVSFAYPGNAAVRGNGVSLRVEKNETVLLLGPSGSGKSTLALCLCGLIPHAIEGTLTGAVRIAGLNTRETEPGELAGIVGTVFQDPDAQAVMMTVEDEVAFGLENMGVPPEAMEERIAAALRTVGLTQQRTMPVERLSGGQKQRLALAAVLAMEPEVLVLDEPTANLDPAGTADVFRALRRLKATGQRAIFLIEHKLDDLDGLVDRVVVIDGEGAPMCSGTPEDVFYDWADQLERLGVWFPQAVEVTRKLQAAGLPLQSRALSMNRLAAELRHCGRIRPADEVNGGCPDADAAAVASGEAGLAPEVGIAPAVGLVPEVGFVPETGLASEAGSLLLDIRPTGEPARRSGGWLRPLGLQVRRGEFWAIVGENGAGKTTLARHLMGLLPVRPGVVFLDGRDAATYPPDELARRIGYVFQNPEHQFVTERVSEEVAFGLRKLGLPQQEIAARVNDLLTRFGLGACADVHPFRLSHGQKRRLSVAAMLAVGQELLILDEPTFGQDRRHAIELLEMLKELQRQGRTILMITHDMTLVAEYAEYAAVLSAGALLAAGPVDRLFADRELLARAGLQPPAIAALPHRHDGKSRPFGDRRHAFTVEGWVKQWLESATRSTEETCI